MLVLTKELVILALFFYEMWPTFMDWKIMHCNVFYNLFCWKIMHCNHNCFYFLFYFMVEGSALEWESGAQYT